MKPQTSERIARALLHEVDRTFRRCYHQTLTDVVQDLRLHNVLQCGDPSPAMLLQAIHENGLLQMHSGTPLAQIHSVLHRFFGGTINICIRCGRSISLKDLERNPTISLCARCRAGKPSSSETKILPEGVA